MVISSESGSSEDGQYDVLCVHHEMSSDLVGRMGNVQQAVNW